MRGNGSLRHGTRGTGPGRRPRPPRGGAGRGGAAGPVWHGVAARGMECWRGITGREVDAGVAATGTQHRRKTGGARPPPGSRRPLRGHGRPIISKLAGPPRVAGGRGGRGGHVQAAPLPHAAHPACGRGSQAGRG